MTAHLLDRYLSDLDPQHLPVAIRAASRYARTDPTPEDVLDTEYGEDGWPAGVASVVSLMGVQALEERTTQCYGDITDAQRRVLWEEYEKRDRSLRDASLAACVKQHHAKEILRAMREEREPVVEAGTA